MSKKSKNNHIIISSPVNFRNITQTNKDQLVENGAEKQEQLESNQSTTTLMDSNNSDNNDQSEDYYYSNNNNTNNNTEVVQPNIPVIPSSSTKPKQSLHSLLKQEQLKKINEKIYYKVTPKLLEEVKEWEEKKIEYSKSIERLLENKSKQLTEIFNEYLQEMKPILDGFEFDDSLKQDIIRKEKSRLEQVQSKLFGSKNASISILEEQIASRKTEINMHNKITLIQAHVKGWLQRNKYKEMKRHIILRNRCALEIIETERTYVQSLSILENQFLIPLQTTRKDLLSSSEITSIFSNSSLIHGVHKELLDSLEKKYSKWSNEQSLAVCFLNLTPFLKLYTQYINNFNNATTTLNECKKRDHRVKDFFFKEKSKELGNRDFLDLQIQPVQRIPRYRLLLTELLQHTPSIHKDYENIKLAIKEIQNLATSINESKRDAEGFEKTVLIQSSLTKNLDIIQPYRKHVKDGFIQFEKRGRLKERYLFLFNDSVLLCKKVQNIFDSSARYSPISFMKLSGAIILLAEDPEFKNGFAILGNEHLYCYTRSPVEQLEWFSILKVIVKELDQSDSTLKKDESKDQPLVREVSKNYSAMELKQSLLSQSNQSNNSSTTSTISNPRNSIKIENSKQNLASPNQAMVIERNSKLFDNPNNLKNSGGSGGNLQYSPTNSSPNLSSTIFPNLNPLSLSNTSNNSSNSNNYSPNSSTNNFPSLQQPQNQQLQQLNLTIRELINIYNDIYTLQNQLFQPSNQLNVIFGSYIKTLNQNEMNQDLQKINEILNRIVTLKSRSITLLKEEEISSSLQNIITQGKDNIGSFNQWLKQAYPMGNADPNSQQPRSIIINLMKWYNNLHKVWCDILDHKSNN